MEKKVSHPFSIPCYMFDCRAQLRPAAFMDIAQEMAAEGSEQLHAADHDLAAHGLVWIIARMQVKFDRYPKRLDNAIVETWHSGLDGLFFIRQYRMLSENGDVQIRSTSSWILMDTASRRVVRSDRLGGIIDQEPQNTEKAVEESTPKVIIPKTCTPHKVREHTVSYSDLDYNGHVNNARYSVWALDTIPAEWTQERDVREITINFNKEARPSEKVDLFLAQDGNTWYVEGRDREGLQNFICEVKF